MTLEELEKINSRSRAALEQARANGTFVKQADYPFYGYVDVDIFECPPFVLFTNNDSPGASAVLYYREFETTSMKVWCRLCKTATGILDIGANVGIYSLAAAKLRPDLAIHAFEPNPYAFSRLRMHKMLNNTENIRENTLAVGSENRLVMFSWFIKAGGNISSGGGIGERKGSNFEKTVVQMVSLDTTTLHTIIGNKPVIKIDVEGGEILAAQGMNNIFALKPDIIIETFSSDACDALNKLMAPLGYQFYKILEKENRLVKQEKLTPCDVQSPDFNQLMTTRSESEIEELLR